jgi:aerobic C4-dicarboxylate transport protein
VRALYRSPFLPLAVPVSAGLVLGLCAPALAVQMQPLAEAFIHLLGWLTYPLIFCMLVSSASTLCRHYELGRVGAYALVYFAALSVLSVLFGLAAGWVLEPGVGAVLAPGATPGTGPRGLVSHGMLDWLDCVPPLRANNLFLMAAAVPAGLLLGLFPASNGLALAERCRAGIFDAIKALLLVAPLAAFGAMAATVGRHGLTAMLPLLKFIVAINLASVLFILIVLGGAIRLAGLSLLRFLVYIRAELYLVFFTSSSLAALAPLSEKLERLGCPRSVTGLVLPFSYSLNLAGTTLYVALGLAFLVQAAQVPLGWREVVLMLGVTLISSKGAVGIPGSGFATLAATVALLHVVPPATVAILLAVDRSMKCRLLTNVIGHGVACVVVAAWDKSLDREALGAALSKA